MPFWCSIPHIAFIERDVVPLKKRPVFLLKCFRPVVFALVSDVGADGSHVGFRNGKCSVSRLPRKSGEFLALGFDPLGRGFFDLLDDLADGNGSGQVEEQVGVVLHRIDKHGGTAEILQDAGHVAVERIAHGIGDEGFTILRAENEVDVEAGEGLRHRLGRPFRAWVFVGDLFPGRCPGLECAAPLGRSKQSNPSALLA